MSVGSIRSVSALLLVACTAAACGGQSSRAQDGDDESHAGGTGASAAGGAAASATGAATSGGTTADAGGSSSAGTGALPVACSGIRNNTACDVEGTECSDLPCGIADTGRRLCTCATNWQCTACDFSNSPLPEPPDPMPPCPAKAADGIGCAVEWDMCGPVGSEYCVCYAEPDGALVWDCDEPPPVCSWC